MCHQVAPVRAEPVASPPLMFGKPSRPQLAQPVSEHAGRRKSALTFDALRCSLTHSKFDATGGPARIDRQEEWRSSVTREPIKKITLKSGEVRYRFTIDAPRGPDGKRRQVTYTFDTMREAREALAKIRVESSTGRYVRPDKTTLTEYLSEWLAAVGRGVEPGTLRAYQDALRVPREQLGHRKMQSLCTPDVTAVVETMLTNGRKKGGPVGSGLGPRSVQMMLTVLRRALGDAVRDRKMDWNPAEGVRGPRLRPRKVTPWTDDEVRAFMDAARSERLHAVWRLSLLALRPEEVAGLRWDSVDLSAETLTVARVQVIVAGKVMERETAKTSAGERTLPLDEGTVNALRQLRRLQRKERLAAGEAYQLGSHAGYVAADEIGAGYSTQRLRGTFYRLVASAGLRKITFYHARHSALSYLLNSGQVPIAVVAAWAGHADGGATALKHYIRVRPGDLEAARDAIAALLGA
jgi:integrase